jgi:hypothetical protein
MSPDARGITGFYCIYVILNTELEELKIVIQTLNIFH